MINYQRYLREKKEVELEEKLLSEDVDLEEASLARQQKRAANIAKGLHPSGRALKPGEAPSTTIGKKAALAGFDTGSTDTATSSVDTDASVPVDAPKPSLKDRIFRAKGVGNDETTPVDDKSKPISKPMDSRMSDTADRLSRGMRSDTMDTRRAVSPDSVGGNSVTEILSSAGGDPASARAVINYVRSALDRAGIRLKDSSFLS